MGDVTVHPKSPIRVQDPLTALRFVHCMYGSRRSSAPALLRALRRASGIFAFAVRSYDTKPAISVSDRGVQVGITR